RHTLRRRRLSAHPAFQGFDTRSEGHVTLDQMERVLSSFGILPE
ncbi:unnamed protein product, partial [Discosporangium mesarthrocarpum]